MTIFKDEVTTSNSNNNNAPTHYYNIYLAARADSGRRKLGALKFFAETNQYDAQIVKWLESHPANPKRLLAMISGEFRSAQSTVEESGFILPSNDDIPAEYIADSADDEVVVGELATA